MDNTYEPNFLFNNRSLDALLMKYLHQICSTLLNPVFVND